MDTHQQIDQRSLELAKAVAEKINVDPDRKGLGHAREVVKRWIAGGNTTPDIYEWDVILRRPWEDVRSILLDTTEYGTRLRQSTPFCGILTPRERWGIYSKFSHHETA